MFASVSILKLFAVTYHCQFDIKFVRGFVVGIGESKKLDAIITCLKTIDPIIDKIFEGLELIISHNYTDVIRGFDMIIGALKLLYKTLDKCTVAHKLLQSLINIVQERPIEVCVELVKKHFLEFIANIISLLEAANHNDTEGIGMSLGGIFKIMYIYVLKTGELVI